MRDILSDTLDNSSNSIPLVSCVFHIFDHFSIRSSICRSEFILFYIIKIPVFHFIFRDFLSIGNDFYSELFSEKLLRNRSGDNPRKGFSPTTPSSAAIVTYPIFEMIRQISMIRPEKIFDITIVF